MFLVPEVLITLQIFFVSVKKIVSIQKLLCENAEEDHESNLSKYKSGQRGI